MKLFVLLGLCCVAAYTRAKNVVDPSPLNYHEKYGIPRAEEIKAGELEDLKRSSGERIVGGFVSPIEAFPYQAGLIIDLLSSAGNSVCGGSILTGNRVLTAAHCWFDGYNQAWRFTVVVGSATLFYGTGGERIPTTTVVIHPSWTPSTITNDIALVVLPTWLTFTSQIQPVALPAGNAAFADFSGNWAMASGYGKTLDSQAGVTTATVLSAVTVQVITNSVCIASFGSFVDESNICTSGAGGVGVCGGDSGGPLTLSYNGQQIVIGISSFVASAGCQLGFPSAYVRVTSYLNWIYANIY